MPGQLTDPLEHLWLMRWSRSCLLEGRSPYFASGLNAPSGVPLGYFPTMHVQALVYLGLRVVTDNDVACFNTIWFLGFVATGLGSFVLTWWTIRRVVPAWLAGLGVMLCGPMLMHAHGHLETMQMGAVPVFLVGWLRFVDRSGRLRLVVAVGLYWLMVACAPYFAVLAVFPAAWYAVWSFIRSKPADRGSWLRDRMGWLAGFGGIALPGLAVLFSGQVWAVVHGYPMSRSRLEFDHLGAPGWSTFLPSPLHALGRFATPDFFASTGYSGRLSECSSYLGMVTLALLAYAAVTRVRFPRSGYWWSSLALMVVLSWGSSLDLGWSKVGMPAGWIYGAFPPFHLIRVPARFNLFAAVCASVPASAALADLLGRVAWPMARAAFATVLAAVMLADLAMVPFETAFIPPMPDVYRDLVGKNPAESLVDAPMFGSNEGQVFSSLWGYWQSAHRARTTAGYPGLPNVAFESEVVRPSPFWAARLLDPAYLAGSRLERFGPIEGVDPLDYAWLYLTTHGFDHVVLHQGTWTDPRYAAGVGRLKALLAEAKVFEDADVAVFARARLEPPRRLTWLCASGVWPSLAKSEEWSFGVLKTARLATFNPSPDRSMILKVVEASAFRRPRVVRLLETGRELARWVVEPGESRTLETPPIWLGEGIRTLDLIADGDDRPTRSVDRLDEAGTAYSLRIKGVRAQWSDGGLLTKESR